MRRISEPRSQRWHRMRRMKIETDPEKVGRVGALLPMIGGELDAMLSPISLPRRAARAALRLGALGPLAVFAVCGPALGAVLLVTTSGSWFPLLEARGPGAVPWLLLGTVLLAGLGLIPTHASSLAAGMLFGFSWGSSVALLGTVGAALLGYGLVMRLVGDSLVERLASGVRARAVHAELVGGSATRTALLVALVRLSPAMPFAATNVLLASAGVRLGTFLAGTLLGIAPRVLIVALAGAGLAELDLEQGRDTRLLVFGGLATLLALVVIGRLALRALRRMHALPAQT